MHNLVKEATAIDFNELGDDLEVAKNVTFRTLGSGLESKDKHAIATCPTVGHLVNEVNMLLHSFFFQLYLQFVYSAISQLHASSVFRLFFGEFCLQALQNVYCSKGCLLTWVYLFYFILF